MRPTREGFLNSAKSIGAVWRDARIIANPAMRNGKSFGESMADDMRRQRELRQVEIETFRLEWKGVVAGGAFVHWLMKMRIYGLPY
ncbi:hypothetical protein J2S70_001183 [Trueperella bonasi]|uniref:Uncharacterized protein n=1 Tax=Trueperella bonasi TaxID=312286 RepID=A0ABT9NGR0_9ACTO|nr:hypothetical protein [Trueperella bonasi]